MITVVAAISISTLPPMRRPSRISRLRAGNSTRPTGANSVCRAVEGSCTARSNRATAAGLRNPPSTNFWPSCVIVPATWPPVSQPPKRITSRQCRRPGSIRRWVGRSAISSTERSSVPSTMPQASAM